MSGRVAHKREAALSNGEAAFCDRIVRDSHQLAREICCSSRRSARSSFVRDRYRFPHIFRRMSPLRLMAVLAHPDDESLGFGGTLAKYAAEGVGTYLTTATRGERGRFGKDGKR